MSYWVYLVLCLLVGGGGLLRLALVAGAAAWTADRRRTLADGLLLLALVPVALFSVRPYLGNNLVGGGDSYHYGLQVADFVTQARQGVLPVLVGQSDHAFNGNVHTLRTAPYFTHLAGVLDFVTGRRLPAVVLQNLTVVLTALLAAGFAFAACLRASGGRRLASWLLAALYVLSPAIMGPLALHDMFATYMAAPWLVWCWHGLAGIIGNADDRRPQLIAAGSLALTWYAHSPIAAWLTMLWGVTQVARIFQAGGTARQWVRQAAAALLCAGLGAYAFVSIGTLGTGNFGLPDLTGRSYNPERLQHVLQTGFTPFVLAPDQAGIQLGWSLWLLLLAGGSLLALRRSLTGLLLLALVAIVLVFLFPLPVVAETVWGLLPQQIVSLTNWPAQRLCPLLAAGVTIIAATALRSWPAPATPAYRACCVLLSLGCVWSLSETGAIYRRPAMAVTKPADYALRFTPDNLTLTRYSYALSPRLPSTFTNGWTDPEFETRLLDRNLDLAQDNPGAVLAHAAATPMTPLPPGRLTVELPGPGQHLVVFAFTHHETVGEITITGPRLARYYVLPRSGEPQAFGSYPACAKTTVFTLRDAGTHQITLGCTVPGVSFRIVPVDRNRLPVRLRGQIPFTADVTAAAAGFLETPRSFLDGYTATVDGASVPVRMSPNGLVMVPVPAGRSTVILNYPGSPLLHLGWLLSVGGFALLPWLLLGARRPLTPGSEPAAAASPAVHLFAGMRRAWRRNPRTCLRAIGAAAVLALLGLAARHAWQEYRSYGSLRMVVELPKQPAARAEPLLTLGVTGAADCVYVVYEDSGHLRLGLDHWGHGGPVSDPLAVNPGEYHTLEFTLGGLYPSGWWPGRRTPEASHPPGVAPFAVRLDGKVILSGTAPFHPATPEQVAVGRNPAGNSVAGATFSGRIISVERFVPDGPAP